MKFVNLTSENIIFLGELLVPKGLVEAEEILVEFGSYFLTCDYSSVRGLPQEYDLGSMYIVSHTAYKAIARHHLNILQLYCYPINFYKRDGSIICQRFGIL